MSGCRIVLLGAAGAGKSTLARRIAAHTGWPAIILDDIWRKGWGKAEAPAFRETLLALHAGDAWVSDGNFAAVSFDIRLSRADLVVWMAAPPWLSAWRVLARTLRPGEPHRLKDVLEVWRFIGRFERINRPRIEAAVTRIAPSIPVLRLRGPDEAAKFLDSLPHKA